MAPENRLITDFQLLTETVGDSLRRRARKKTINGDKFVDGDLAEEALLWGTMEEAVTTAATRLHAYRKEENKGDIDFALTSAFDHMVGTFAETMIVSTPFPQLLRITAAAYDISSPNDMALRMEYYYRRHMLPGKVGGVTTNNWFHGTKFPSEENYKLVEELFRLEGRRGTHSPIQEFLVELLHEKYFRARQERKRVPISQQKRRAVLARGLPEKAVYKVASFG